MLARQRGSDLVKRVAAQGAGLVVTRWLRATKVFAALTANDEAADDKAVVPLRQLDVLHLPSREDLPAEVDRLRAALRQIQDLAGTPVEEARALAGLLRDALRHRANHPDQPCPVCGGRILDEAWATEAKTRLHRLTERAPGDGRGQPCHQNPSMKTAAWHL